jgi:hypothetical protein
MDIIEKKEHLILSGFYQILSIKSMFPKGLSPEVLEVYFNKFILIIKPVFESSNILLDHN